MAKHGNAVLGYGLSVAANAVVTLATVPIVIEHSGAAAWGSVALGQAIGSGFAILVGYGWGTTGPTDVAAAAPNARMRVFVDSFRARLTLIFPALALAAIIAFHLGGDFKTEAALSAAAFTLTGMLSGWYFTGSAKPLQFLLLETLPRVLGTAAGGTALLLGVGLFAFPGLQLMGVLLGIVLSGGRITRWKRSSWRPHENSSIRRSLRLQSHGVVIAAVAAVNISLPISLVAVVDPSALATYAFADKILRFSTTVFAPVMQFLQGLVPSAEGAEMRRRIRFSFLVGLSWTLLAAVTFALALPWLSGLLSHNKVLIDHRLSVPFALVLLFVIMESVTGTVCLLALRRGAKVALFNAVGVALTVLGVLAGVSLFGAVGAAWALALSAFVAWAPQVVVLVRVMRETADLETFELAVAGEDTPNSGTDRSTIGS